MAVSTDCPLLSLLAKRSVRCRPRLQHGAVELTPKTVQDATGALAEPYSAVDTFEMLDLRSSPARSNRSSCAIFPPSLFSATFLR